MGRIDEKILGERRINHQNNEIWNELMRKSRKDEEEIIKNKRYGMN